MMTHSQGPWTRKSIPGHLFEINDASGNPILRIKGGMMPSLADSLVMTAAPDLLMALELFVTKYTALVYSGDCGNWDPETDNEVMIARLAIAKATVA